MWYSHIDARHGLHTAFTASKTWIFHTAVVFRASWCGNILKCSCIQIQGEDKKEEGPELVQTLVDDSSKPYINFCNFVLFYLSFSWAFDSHILYIAVVTERHAGNITLETSFVHLNQHGSFTWFLLLSIMQAYLVIIVSTVLPCLHVVRHGVN